MPFRRRYYNVAPTLRQLCKKRPTGTIHDRTVIFQQPCFKAAEKINNDIRFLWYVGYVKIISLLNYLDLS